MRLNARTKQTDCNGQPFASYLPNVGASLNRERQPTTLDGRLKVLIMLRIGRHIFYIFWGSQCVLRRFPPEASFKFRECQFCLDDRADLQTNASEGVTYTYHAFPGGRSERTMASTKHLAVERASC